MDAQRLSNVIWQGITKKVYSDRIDLFIPFFFTGCSDAPLCLTWDRKGVLSDGGRTLSELEGRVGNIQPYLHQIRSILARCGDCKLIGGRVIVKDHFQTVMSGEKQYQDYLGGMNHMLMAITQISIIDQIRVLDDGRVIA